MANRSNSPGRSDLSRFVIGKLEDSGHIKRTDTILNVHHYNSQQDQHQGRPNDASQIVTVRSRSTGRELEVHSHDHGRYHSRTEVVYDPQNHR